MYGCKPGGKHTHAIALALEVIQLGELVDHHALLLIHRRKFKPGKELTEGHEVSKEFRQLPESAARVQRALGTHHSLSSLAMKLRMDSLIEWTVTMPFGVRGWPLSGVRSM